MFTIPAVDRNFAFLLYGRLKNKRRFSAAEIIEVVREDVDLACHGCCQMATRFPDYTVSLP